jgi:hypothetical protein
MMLTEVAPMRDERLALSLQAGKALAVVLEIVVSSHLLDRSRELNLRGFLGLFLFAEHR